MESGLGKDRLGRASEIAAFIDPSFYVMPPTVMFPYPVVAHNDLGLCAIIVREDVMLYDPITSQWFAAGVSFEPDSAASDAAYDLAVAARAPKDRCTAIVWLPSGINADMLPPGSPVAVSADPQVASAMVEDRMRRALAGSNEPVSSWLGAYCAAAAGRADKMKTSLRYFSQALEFSLANLFGTTAIVAYGIELSVSDIADPGFILPALMVSASEDWELPTSAKPRGTGFDVKLDPDPTALLGYRLTDIKPAIPFTAMAPALSAAKRTFDGEDFIFDDLIRQFTRWLEKKGLDATVLDDIELRIATSG